MRIDDTGTPGERLYNYLLGREKEYKMRVLRMNPSIIDKMNGLVSIYLSNKKGSPVMSATHIVL